MRHISFDVSIYARRETVWKLMVDKAVNPEEYIPGVLESKIVERHNGEFVREVRTEGMTLREKVTFDEPSGEVRYLLMEHPLVSGRVVNRVVAGSVQSPVAPQRFTIEVEWTPQDTDAERIVQASLPAQLQREVLSLKEKAEATEGAR